MAKRTIHLSPAEDAFLEAVFLAGRQDPAGKFDASRSAVVRLALSRLAADMDPGEIVQELRSREVRQATGRPRH